MWNALALSTLLLVSPALAEDDQTRARAAFESGGARPLVDVLAVARTAVPGDVVAIELKRRAEAWIYELRIVTPSGLRREVEIDARTLAVIEVEAED